MSRLPDFAARPEAGLLLQSAAVFVLAVGAAGLSGTAWRGGSGTAWRGLVLLLFAPVVEEIIFRRGLQEFLLSRRWPGWQANLAVWVMFALAHWALRGSAEAAALVLPALLLGALYGWRRRLAPCVLAHALMNGIWLLAVPTLP